MASRRSPDRDKAFEIWRYSGGTAKLKDIANEIGVPDSRIRKWKTLDKWDEKLMERSTSSSGALHTINGSAPPKRGAPKGNKNAKGHGAPPGNKNAVGNKGGPPLGSKNALKTGEYETIWFDTLTEEEQSLFDKIDTDPLVQAEQEIIFFTFRERRMMERIKRLMNGLTEKEKRIVSELREEKQAVEMYDEKTAQTKTVMVPVPKMVVTSITETHSKAIDEILRIEDSLTRAQQQKARWVALKQDIEVQIKKSQGGKEEAIAAHNATINTLASLLQSPVANRPIEAFEDESDKSDS